MTSIVIPDGPKGRSGIHPSARAINGELARWIPALAALGRDDNRICGAR